MINNLIVKVTTACNIHCKYCYVRRGNHYRSDDGIMPVKVLRALMGNLGVYLRQNPSADRFTFYWHGGEPMLAGKPFYKEAVRLQEALIPPGVAITNTFQTNGVGLDDYWIAMLRDLGFEICISLDGPIELNDKWRIRKDGKGTYESVLHTINLLKKHDVLVSILSVITPDALGKGRELYRHFRALDCQWMDFMYPFTSVIDNTTDAAADARLWGHFLIDVFDSWLEEGNPEVYIRMLHDFCISYLGGKTAMCIFGSDCSYVLTVDPAGNIYTCDDIQSYMDSLLGNITRDSLDVIERHPGLAQLKSEHVLFGENCLSCSYFPVCKGGCTLFRANSYGDFHGKHYFCESQKMIIDHIANYFSSIPKTSSVLHRL